jgi:two-component system, cell cycle response regulator
LKILIAEDDMVSRCLLEELLIGWGHDVIVAEDGEAALAIVQRGVRFDVAVLDWMMPGVAGVTVCKRISERSAERHPYILMLTAKSQLEDIVSGLDAGADEYLTKPYRPAELAARLRAAQRFLRVQDDLIGAQRIVAYQAAHDVLTGALNRATLLSRMHALVLDRRRRPSPVSVLRVDIAGFSRVNDLHGVGVGDEVLRGLVDRLRTIAPPGSAIGRNGPDEFLVLLAEADEDAAAGVAGAITQGVRLAPIATQAGQLVVTVDVGVVTARAGEELDLGWLLSSLDAITSIGAAGRKPKAPPLSIAAVL